MDGIDSDTLILGGGALLLLALIFSYLWYRGRSKPGPQANSSAPAPAPSISVLAPTPLPATLAVPSVILFALMQANYQVRQWQGSLSASGLSDDDLCFMEATAASVPWNTIVNGEWDYICGRTAHAINYRMPTFVEADYQGPLRHFLAQRSAPT